MVRSIGVDDRSIASGEPGGGPGKELYHLGYLPTEQSGPYAGSGAHSRAITRVLAPAAWSMPPMVQQFPTAPNHLTSLWSPGIGAADGPLAYGWPQGYITLGLVPPIVPIALMQARNVGAHRSGIIDTSSMRIAPVFAPTNFSRDSWGRPGR